jgi:hypothetical protein
VQSALGRAYKAVGRSIARRRTHVVRMDSSGIPGLPRSQPWKPAPGASMLMTASPLETSSVNSANPSYRPDIDGLRAVAVLAVVFYHFRLGMPLEASSGSMSFS